jgi:CO/xanthine dehydrogenase FAD-binding subunit
LNGLRIRSRSKLKVDGIRTTSMPITVRTFATLTEAAAVLSADRDARFLVGGTLVMRAVNEGDTGLATIVRSTDRAFTQVRPAGPRIEIGAGVTMAQILRLGELAFLHQAARTVGGPAIRSMATVGGNLFAPSPYGDFTTALLALDATVSVQGGHGGRDVPLEEFLAGRERGMRELVASVSLARPVSPDVFRFRKVSRVNPKGIAVLTIAALLPLAGGRVAGARVAYGAMGPTPQRARPVERALEGHSLDPAAIAAAIAAAVEGISAASDAIASDWYRREILPVHLRRLLLGIAS